MHLANRYITISAASIPTYFYGINTENWFYRWVHMVPIQRTTLSSRQPPQGHTSNLSLIVLLQISVYFQWILFGYPYWIHILDTIFILNLDAVWIWYAAHIRDFSSRICHRCFVHSTSKFHEEPQGGVISEFWQQMTNDPQKSPMQYRLWAKVKKSQEICMVNTVDILPYTAFNT